MPSLSHPLPWKVYVGKLRPKPFDVPIVEIFDDDDELVLPWQSFDHLPTMAAKKRLATLIVRRVNSGGIDAKP